MTIETKYNIGDEVWTLNFFSEPVLLTVYGIIVSEYENTIHIAYKVGYSSRYNTVERVEEYLFTTKEELLNSL